MTYPTFPDSNARPDGLSIEALVARAHQDPAFYTALLTDTAAALAPLGVAFPPWLRLRGIENGEPVFVLRKPADAPATPAELPLSDADLEGVAAGYFDQNGEWVETFNKGKKIGLR